MEKIPEFKEVRFTGKDVRKQLNEWLEKTAKWEIHFEDMGQDVLTMWVHKSGEILYSDMQAVAWCGKFINPEFVNEGSALLLWDHDSYKSLFGLCIKTVRTLND